MDIRISGLRKAYGDVAAVHDVALHAREGRVLGFLGPNGAGKSTTLRCLLGLAAPDGGTAHLGGRAYGELEEPAGIVGALLDPGAHHPERSGRDHLRVLCAAGGIPDRRADEVLEDVELSGAGRRRAGSYSLGMRQRLHLAAALLGDPPLLVLDEPTNGLDPQGIRWLRDRLRALAREGRTVLLSSHVLPEVSQVVDDVVILARGRTVAAGRLGEVLGAAGSHLEVRSPEPARVGDLVARLGGGMTAVAGEDLRVTGVGAEALAREALASGTLLTRLTEVAPDLEARYFALTEAAA